MRVYRIKFPILLAVSLCAASIAPYAASPAFANSAQTHWEGVTSSGVFIHGGQCPLEVENEKLTFNIPGFPSNYYDSAEEFAEYGANVKAEYTFYNPEDYGVTATLVFPFGTAEYYIPGEIAAGDTEKYQITAGGEEVAKTVRHTYKSYGFDVSADLGKLRDGYAEDDFFSRSLPVTVYSYDVSGISEADDRNKAPYAAFSFDKNPQTRLMVSKSSGVSVKGDKISVGTLVKNGDTVFVYAIGEPLGAALEWTVYENGGERKKIDGSVTRNEEKSFALTFENLAMTYWKEESGVSETDWYNACVEFLKTQGERDNFLGGTKSLDLTRNLLRWYKYELEVPAKSRVVNTVTAPLYPSIDGRYSPALFDYEYLSSPAKTWKSFGGLEITVKTPYYILADGGLGFRRADDGYSLSLDSLPEGEINFTLCSVENPQRVFYGGGTTDNGWLIWLYTGLTGLACIAAAVGIYFAVKHRSKRNKNK